MEFKIEKMKLAYSKKFNEKTEYSLETGRTFIVR